MTDMEEARTLLVCFDAKVHRYGILLHLLTYDAPALQEALVDEPGLRVRVFLNPFDVGTAIASLPNGAYVTLAVGRPDYASGRSLANHLENVRRLAAFNRSRNLDLNGLRLLLKDDDGYGEDVQ